MVVRCRLLVSLGRLGWLMVDGCRLLVSLSRKAYSVAERSRSDISFARRVYVFQCLRLRSGWHFDSWLCHCQFEWIFEAWENLYREQVWNNWWFSIQIIVFHCIADNNPLELTMRLRDEFTCSKQADSHALLAMTLVRECSVGSASFQMFSLVSTTISSSEFRGTRNLYREQVWNNWWFSIQIIVFHCIADNNPLEVTMRLRGGCRVPNKQIAALCLLWRWWESVQLAVPVFSRQFSVIFVSEYHCQFEWILRYEEYACPPTRRVSRTGLEQLMVLDTNYSLPLHCRQ